MRYLILNKKSSDNHNQFKRFSKKKSFQSSPEVFKREFLSIYLIGRKEIILMRLYFKRRHLYEDREPIAWAFPEYSSIIIKIVLYTKERGPYDRKSANWLVGDLSVGIYVWIWVAIDFIRVKILHCFECICVLVYKFLW
jgi:hypothetical protein